MDGSETLKRKYGFIAPLLTALCAIQPLLDVLSYWMQNVSWGSMLTTLLRAIILLGLLVCALCVTDRKKLLLVIAAVFAVLYACHLYAYSLCDYEMTARGVLEDFSNYIRIIHLPLLAVTFIVFLRKCEDGYEHIQKGLLIAFFVIAAVELLSWVTGTNPYTYPNKEIGLLGWFYFANSQSAILSMLFPLVLCHALQKDRFGLAAVISVIGFGELYLFATRLAYLAIFAVAVGTLFTWFVCRKLKLKNAVLILVCATLCAACYFVSPMYENRSRMDENAVLKQERIDELVQKGIEEFGTEGGEYLLYAYNEYMPGLVDRFGIDRLAEFYNYSTDMNSVANDRDEKINFCRLLLEDSPAMCRVFGLPFEGMSYFGTTYDVENDFHGVYFLYGAAGLGVTVAFLLYFVFIVAKALLKDAKKYFTPEAGACGIALCMGLVHAYCTAGVLRRPNASFYLSLTLAVIWYLIYIKSYDEKEN